MKTQQNQYLEEVLEAVKVLENATQKLSALWIKDYLYEMDLNDHLIRKYPFAECLSDVHSDMIGWGEDVENVIKILLPDLNKLAQNYIDDSHANVNQADERIYNMCAEYLINGSHEQDLKKHFQI